MFNLSNENAEICVVGRCDFATGLGLQTYAMCELLSRSYPVSILPTEGHLRAYPSVYLPNGRKIPVCSDMRPILVAIFVDVLWNGAYDRNYLLLPQHALRFASIMFDSDTLPQKWVEILNTRFDVAIAPTTYCAELLVRSGVEIPFVILPLALDIESALTQDVAVRRRRKFTFGSVAAFHPRKDPEVLLRAFLQSFHGNKDVELILHSNLAFGDTLARLNSIVEDQQAANVTITNTNLSSAEKDRLVDSFDVFVSCSRGEGYSVGPREALARGKVLVISDVGGHKDLAGVPGVFTIPANIEIPARYPEIDNLVFGSQWVCDVDAVQSTLQRAFEYAQSADFRSSVHARRSFAGEFSFSRLASSYAALINTEEFAFRKSRAAPRVVSFSKPAVARIAKALGDRANKLRHVGQRVIQAHDGGFYSVFNTYLSHLVWDLREERCHSVLPDWNVNRMMTKPGFKGFTSWCYAGLEEGNAWTKLFEPLFGLSSAEMDDPEILDHNAIGPDFTWNEHREPLLTYKNAYKLYRTPGFQSWRQQYHAVYMDHIRLRPEFAAEIDSAANQMLNRAVLIGAHVRHPSHVMEQPNERIPYVDHYISNVRDELARRGINPESDEWRVFLATDQHKVVEKFVTAFGERAVFFSDVKRTSREDDERFEALSEEAKKSDGHQVQHLTARAAGQWSSRMAWEIIRDASMLARCHSLLHVTSNVSTAVSYLNPKVELIYCEPL